MKLRPSLLSSLRYVSLAYNALNALLDPLLVFGCGLGVAGAALATALSEAVGGAVFVALLMRRGLLRAAALRRPPALKTLVPLLSGGAVMQVRTLALNGAFASATRAAQALDASGVLAAAYSVTQQLSLLGSIVLFALQSSAATLVPAERGRALARGGDGAAAARRVADRLFAWGALLGVALAAAQLLSLPLLGAFSSLPAVCRAARAPAVIAAADKLCLGPVLAGEGVMIGLGSFGALAAQTALGAGAMVATLRQAARRGWGLEGIFCAIAVFNVVQLAGVLRHHLSTGPLAREARAARGGE